MRVRLCFMFAFLAGTLFPARKAYAQPDTLRPRRNIIEVFNSRNNSLNGIYPNIQKEYGSLILRANWGASYMRILGEREVGLELSFNPWLWGANDPQTAFDSVGKILVTESYYFSARVQYPLIKTKEVKWYLSGGPTLRTGDEVLVVQAAINSPIKQDGIAIGHPQRDIGLSVGSRFSWNPWWRIVLSTDLRYTRFIYRYTTSSKYLPDYKGTTQNLLSLQLKVGIAF